MDEEKILERARKGNKDAFSALVERKERTVFWIAHGILGNREDARDATQKVFIKVWKNIGKYDPRYPFNTWLKRITVNQCIDSLRQMKGREGISIHELSSLEKKSMGIPSLSTAQERELLREEVEMIFKDLSARLSPKQRIAFVLKELEEHSISEIAEIMKTSESTVRNHLFQARKSLKEHLKKLYPEYLPKMESELEA